MIDMAYKGIIRKKMKKNGRSGIHFIAGTIAALLVLSIVNMVIPSLRAPEPPAHNFHGYVRLNGELVVDGTNVSIWDNESGVLLWRATTYTPWGSQGQGSYSIDVRGGWLEDSTWHEGFNASDTVIFKIDDLTADQTGTWSSGSSTYLDLCVWSKRKPINLWVDSGETPADYQVLLNISYDSDMNSDFSDLRFVRYSDNTTELDYWIEHKVDGQWAHVWVEIADSITTANETLAWLYYGNPNATSNSNGEDTFLFFDDFEDGIYRDKWHITENTDRAGVAYQLWGKLFLRTKEVGRTISIATDDTFATMFSDTDGVVLEHDVWTRHNPPYPKGKDGSLRSYLINASDSSQWVMGTYSGWSGKVRLYNHTGTSTLLGRTSRRTHNIHAEMGLGCNASYAWMNWSEINDPGWVEDDFNGSISTDAFSGATSVQIKLELHCGGSNEGKWSQVAFDNVRLRKYHDPEPKSYLDAFRNRTCTRGNIWNLYCNLDIISFFPSSNALKNRSQAPKSTTL